MAKVAFLGLGVMGFPMAGHLAKKGGHEVTVYNRTAAKAEAMGRTSSAASAAPTPKAAAEGQDFVMCCVGNDNDLRAVTIGADGAFAGMKKGATFVDHTTASAEVARELDAAANKRGFKFVDAPVSGGQAGAENGVLTVMCGGDEAAYAGAEPIIAAYARMCKLLGPPARGQLTKMVNQICIAGLVQGLSEGIHFAKKSRPRRRGRDRHHLEGRRAVLADGEPLQDHERGQVRFRLRGRMDAQGPRRSASPKPAATAPPCRSTALVDQFYAEVEKMGGKRWDTSSLLGAAGAVSDQRSVSASPVIRGRVTAQGRPKTARNLGSPILTGVPSRPASPLSGDGDRHSLDRSSANR